MPLFRHDAIARQQQKFYGSILLARPLSFVFLTGFFVIVAATIILFFFMFGFTRKEAVPGVLIPENGLIRVYTPQAGVLVERKAQNGQAVVQGDILFIISGERASSSKGDTQSAIGRSLNTRIEKLQTEMTQQQAQTLQQQAALVRRRHELNGQIEHIGNEIALQQKRLQIAETAAQRFSDLKQSNFVSEAQVQDKLAEMLDQQARLRTLERSLAGIQMDVTQVDSEILTQPLKARREVLSLERGIAEIEQGVVQNEALRQIVVRAPKSGIVTGAIGEPGQVLNTNQILAALIPAGEKLEAELYAPSRAIGFIKPGMKVLLRYQAFPYQKFGQYTGTVSDISNTTINATEIGLPFAYDPSTTDPLYRIRVRLDHANVTAYGKTEELKSGMQLDASLVLEYRKLFEWVIEPLYTVTGRI
jgi:membrane fusion protein